MIAELFHWLATPISGASDHAIAMPLAWHGRLMVLAMGLLTPPLIIVARFFKIMPRQDWPRQLDNPFWFTTHRRLGHIVGAIVAIAMAFVLVERGWESPVHNLHTAAGWLVSCWCWPNWLARGCAARMAGLWIRSPGNLVRPRSGRAIISA